MGRAGTVPCHVVIGPALHQPAVPSQLSRRAGSWSCGPRRPLFRLGQGVGLGVGVSGHPQPYLVPLTDALETHREEQASPFPGWPHVGLG